jgi:hypothetical protein
MSPRPRNNAAKEAIARQIIELVKTGERDFERMSEIILAKARNRPARLLPGDDTP